MKDAMLKIQVASLTGGHFVQTSVDGASDATALGAVAALAKPETEASLDAFLDELSIHPLCSVQDYRRYSAVYERHPEPGYYVLADTGAEVATHRVFLKIETEEDLRGIDQETLLVVVRNSDLLTRALEARDQADPAIPVFFEVQDEGGAVEALRRGADGTLAPGAVDLDLVLDRWLADQEPTAVDPSVFNIGVVALQGDYRFHVEQLRNLIAQEEPIRTFPIRRGTDLEQCDAVVLPGGWSNLQTILYRKTGIDRVARSFKDQGKPVLGICAGMILAGTGCGRDTKNRTLLKLIDVTIDNNILNGNGLEVEVTSPGPATNTNAAFSNGPIARILGEDVKTITRLIDEVELKRLVQKKILEPGEDCVVAARQGSVFIASYHEGPGTHDVFLNACRNQIRRGH